VVVQFGTVGQAYGLALLAITAAFGVSVLSTERKQWMVPFAAGVLAGVGASATLLTAPVGPVLLIWMVIYDRTGSRWSKSGAFVAGEAIPFIPVVWLLALGPRQTWFGIIQYNLLYRQVQWPGAIRHDLEVLAGWIDFPQGIILGLLALAGLLFVHFRSGWDRQSRGVFYLCACLALALTIHISSAHPTFARYYLFTTPFLSYLAAAGLYWVATQLRDVERPWLPVILVCLLVSLGLAKALYDNRDDYDWSDLEQIAAQVEKVTPPGKTLYANEQIYFLLHRTPPSGFELNDSHKLEFPPERAALLHVIPQSVLDQQIQAGHFDTIASCEDEEWNDARHLGDLYAMEADVGDCAVYWGWKGAASK
jgi:4-amino-4-deoxy-L-arabinose transferase-like glycosyltransferase